MEVHRRRGGTLLRDLHKPLHTRPHVLAFQFKSRQVDGLDKLQRIILIDRAEKRGPFHPEAVNRGPEKQMKPFLKDFTLRRGVQRLMAPFDDVSSDSASGREHVNRLNAAGGTFRQASEA